VGYVYLTRVGISQSFALPSLARTSKTLRCIGRVKEGGNSCADCVQGKHGIVSTNDVQHTGEPNAGFACAARLLERLLIL
jgi:hypothetical protein